MGQARARAGCRATGLMMKQQDRIRKQEAAGSSPRGCEDWPRLVRHQGHFRHGCAAPAPDPASTGPRQQPIVMVE